MQFGCRLFPARFLFSAFLRRLAQSSRAISLVLVVFRLVVHFHVLPRAGPASSGSASRPLLCRQHAPVRAACCRGLRVRRAWRRLFFVFIPSHAYRPSGQPFFSACFRVFPTSTRQCVCLVLFPSSICITLYYYICMYVRAFRGLVGTFS